MEEIIQKFQECLDTWLDLPEYVYSEEYKKAMVSFVEKRKAAGHKVDSYLIISILHHETGDRLPYFEFDRD